MTTPASPPASAYWRQTLRLSAVLLLLWLALTLGVGLFGQSLAFKVFGWPFGFWVTSQGALIVFCLIVWYYAWAMNRLDEAEGSDSGD
jgi:putative solute:sodium symporter small subunit